MPAAADKLHDPLETLCVHPLHATASVRVYDVLCRAHNKRRGPEEQPLAHQIVFPRRGVFEFESRGEKVVADANHVLFFNRDDTYRVAHPAGAGDDCTVFAFEDRLLRDALELVDPGWLDVASGRALPASSVPGALSQPFRRIHGLNDARLFAALERLRRAAQSPHPEPLALDEAAIALLAAVLRGASRARAPAAKAARLDTRGAHSELVQCTTVFLATAFGQSASLDDVGRAVHASPFHLARLFRRESGVTIHQYRHRLRLRAALARIADGEANLSDLALELGFSSHSHLTDAFRLAFGLSPAAWRKSLDVRRLRESSKDLEVLPPARL